MFASKSQSSSSGIIIFDEEIIVKEMLFTEFQAILEGVIGEADLANMQYRSIYFEVDPQLNLVGVVCFIIGFDEAGCVEKNWNLPLQKLLSKHAKPIKSARKTLKMFDKKICPNRYDANQFWQLDPSKQEKVFEKIEQLIKENKLGLFSNEEVKVFNKNTAPNDSGEVDNSSDKLHDSNEITAIGEQYNETHHQDRLRAASTIRKLRREITHLQKKNHSLSQDNNELLDSIKEQEQLQADLHDEQKREIRRLNNKHKDALLNLEERFRKELQSKLIDKSSDLKELLEIKEAETFYQAEQINTLRDELEKLRSA